MLLFFVRCVAWEQSESRYNSPAFSQSYLWQHHFIVPWPMSLNPLLSWQGQGQVTKEGYATRLLQPTTIQEGPFEAVLCFSAAQGCGFSVQDPAGQQTQVAGCAGILGLEASTGFSGKKPSVLLVRKLWCSLQVLPSADPGAQEHSYVKGKEFGGKW